jgi:hypothetical protein
MQFQAKSRRKLSATSTPEVDYGDTGHLTLLRSGYFGVSELGL